MARNNRRQEILQILAAQLQKKPGHRITTASLAKAVGVSEAALYRHFPSKGKMYEGLLEFAEKVVFARVAQIKAEARDANWKCQQICTLVLRFADKNPGIARLLVADVLLDENQKLRQRANQFFSRLETEIKQILREANTATVVTKRVSVPANANLLVAVLMGRYAHFVGSDFTVNPLEHWEHQWSSLGVALFS